MTSSCFTRRQWIGGLLASPLAGAGGYRPSVAAAFYVWTQQFSAKGQTLADGVAEASAATRRAGYRSVELMSNFFQPGVREKTVAALRETGLALPSVYHGGILHESAGAEKMFAETLSLAGLVKPLGARWINVNPSPKPHGERKTDAELEAQARFINQLGARLKELGLHLQLHHHSPEMAENAREWRRIARNTDAALVSFCIDVHWVLRGGQDPMTILKEAGSRIASLHLRNSREGIWLEDFGDGEIDYRAVAAYLRQIRFGGVLVVELAYEKGTKITRSLEEDLKIGRQYTKTVFGV
ncbi:MAG TPA: sugar phosphate isomerase/epimerase [Bryobacteraceae bacterium]|nr:sugar phosphate isomerase/epimerase [Bryobacteraceae bacterium]